jgi:homoserine dehydrogenase
MAPEAIRVGLVGCGTIGRGVVRLFQEHDALIRERLGFPLELCAIADIDLSSDRGVSLGRYRTTTDWREIARDPSLDVVIELVGGTTIARDVVRTALSLGKRVVTANKALLAHHGAELYREAEARGGELAFEASVGGTIPVLRALREGLCADRIESIFGIVNGTCNFILTEMEARGEPYEVCLKRAQDLGFAEADPSTDVRGIDAQHKLAILLGLGLGLEILPGEIPTRGIESISPLDIDHAQRFELRIKLLAIARAREGRVEASVQPALIPAASVLARVDGAMNAVHVRGRFSGPTLYYGAGAGSLPTASAVVADVMEQARSLRTGAAGRVPPLGTVRLGRLPLLAEQDLEGEYYLRFSGPDQPGVLAEITGALAAEQISIASLLQPERHASQAVPIVLVTHRAKQAAVQASLERIRRSGAVGEPPQLLRIEREF